MEMHIVYKNTNLNDKNNVNLVIGVLFDYNSEYDDNQFLNDINLPKEKEMENASILSLINKDDEFYYYKGNLTTVPCTENVNWIVFKDIKHISYEFTISLSELILSFLSMNFENAFSHL